MVGVREGETGTARDRVAGAAPLVLAERERGRIGVLAEREGGLVGGWGPVLASKEKRVGREGRRFPWFIRIPTPIVDV